MKLATILLFFILLFAVYQDFPLVNSFGELAKSPIVFLMPFFLLYILNARKMPVSEYVQVYLLYLGYALVMSVIYTLYLVIKNQSFYVFDQHLVVKNIKMLAYPICSLLFYQFVYVFLKRTQNLLRLYQVVFAVQITMLVLLLFEAQVYKTREVFLPFLHSNPEKYWRIRLLTFESSWSGSVVVILTFLPVFFTEYLKRTTTEKLCVYVISAFFFFYYTLHSESKGYLFLVLISLLPMLLAYMYKNKRLRYVLFAALIPLVITFGIVFGALRDEILIQLNTSITFGTRFTGYLASLQTFFNHPLGIGFAPYTEIYTQSIERIVQTEFMQQYNLNEVKMYLESPQFLSSKTYFFDHLLFGGLGFLLFFYLFFIRRLRRISKIKNIYPLRIVLVYIILASIFYLTFHIKYEVWFFLAFLDYFENNHAHETS